MKLRTFLQSLITVPVIGCASAFVGNSPEEIKHRNSLNNESLNSKTVAPEQFKVGDIVKYNDWAAYPSKAHLVRLSVVTCVWNDGMVLLDDHTGISTSCLTKIGYCDSISAYQGVICNKSYLNKV